MIDFKRHRVSILREVAVFAHAARWLNDTLPGGLVHETRGLLVRSLFRGKRQQQCPSE
jgi:hypothetical protein